MDCKEYLDAQVSIGYSKSDLERLIGLPKNFLSGFLSGKKNLGAKNKLRVLNWSMVEDKPTPLEVDNYLKKLANERLGSIVFQQPTPTSFHTEKIDNIKHDEVGQWEEPKNTVNTIPKTYQELKDMCPKELVGIYRSIWIKENRVKYNL